MSNVSEILREKGGSLYRIDAEASVLDAVRSMVEANVGALLVTENGEITGIVTERDYLRRVTLEGRDERETPVREVMTKPLVVVTPDTSVEECLALVTERRIRHLPVAEQGQVTGLVSIGDLVKFVSKRQSFELRYLHEYINAR